MQPPSRYNRDITVELEDLILQTLAKDPSRRLGDVAELLERLNGVFSSTIRQRSKGPEGIPKGFAKTQSQTEEDDQQRFSSNPVQPVEIGIPKQEPTNAKRWVSFALVGVLLLLIVFGLLKIPFSQLSIPMVTDIPVSTPTPTLTHTLTMVWLSLE